MNQYLKNLNELYSIDDNVSQKAFFEKSSWIFKKLYVPIYFSKKIENNLEIYEELYALLDSSFLFKKLSLDDFTFKNVKLDRAKYLQKEFNKNYSYLVLENEIDRKIKNGFYVEIDMSKNTDFSLFCLLSANFFPCFSSSKELELDYYSNDSINVLKLPMVRESGNVIILPDSSLVNGRLYNTIIKEIYYSKELSLEQKETIEEIGKRLKVKVNYYD